MPEQSLRFSPVYGGYAVHLPGCTHTLPEVPHYNFGPRLLVFKGASLTDAVASLYRSQPEGVTQPDRFLLRECAKDVRLCGLPGGWDAQHAELMYRAAHHLWTCSSQARGAATNKLNDVLEDSQGLKRPEQWMPEAYMLRDHVSAVYALTLWDNVCSTDDQPGPDDDGVHRRFLMRAEAALRHATERLLMEEGQFPEPMQQGVSEAQRHGARAFLRAVRGCLAPVHAHRALRDGCIRPPQ